jgi:chromate reductase, NAD(P)H dehydrogenase (quinone)
MITSNQSELLFFSGSNSASSINRKMVEALARAAQTNTAKVIDLKNFVMPFYSDEEEARGVPAEALSLLEVIDKHDVLIIAVPQHNHSLPAFFKNTIDWMSRARSDYRIFNGKKIILLSATSGSGSDDIVVSARIVLQALGGNVVGAAILNDFYKQTINKDQQIEIISTGFLSEFENLLALAS